VLFNTPEFIQPTIGDGCEFVSYTEQAERTIGTFSGVAVGDVLWSPRLDGAPFGGPDVVRRGESVGNVVALVTNALDSFRRSGIKRVNVRLRPA
jgi:hypothetical protein